MPTQRNHLGVAAIDGRLYVAGGRFGSGQDVTVRHQVFRADQTCGSVGG